ALICPDPISVGICDAPDGPVSVCGLCRNTCQSVYNHPNAINRKSPCGSVTLKQSIFILQIRV
ncbi:hypothetical protein, partial [uncultured Phyllobacterium sp.]|uniref:hypothetical protein n=1 Tax=uncultured Phyllobacterium sp. TaxID=253813 RepID=UPI002585A5AE